jgi:hypothetical protein
MGCLIVLVLRLENEGQALDFSLYGMGTYAGPSDSEGTFAPGLGYGGGASLGIALTRGFALEVGGMQLVRNFSSGTGAGRIDFRGTSLSFPFLVQFRKGIGRGQAGVSLGLGGYYSMTSGQLHYRTSIASFETEYARTRDYGVMGNLRFYLGGSGPRVFSEVQYQHGLADIGNGSTPLRYRSFIFAIGLSFRIFSGRAGSGEVVYRSEWF